MADTATPHDSHHAGHGHAKPRYDDINIGVVLLIGAISAIVTFLLIAFLQGLWGNWNNSVVRERSYDTVNQAQVDIIDSQQAKLAGVPEAGVISIDQAIDEVVAAYGKTESSE